MHDTSPRPVPVPVEKQAFRDAMARLAAAVNIITTDGPAGRAGFTASAVCSVTDAPPTLLVCLNRQASVWPTFEANRVLCVNTLAAGQEALSTLFGGKTPMVDRFAAADWQQGTTGAPILRDAVAAFDCRVSEVVSVGTHDILFCQVLALTGDVPRHGLIWFNRGYHHVPRLDARS
ncbi:NADH-dependent FMN reductase RutF [Pantoea sp. 1.19]|uniref:NADH-dependent FMN reductase RutF n=1 Tax=Pantoea sp. 1.19 TaxID=1925589 RepID=UPI0009491B32|nr:pyrimidine utilization flavin reductase protein F [Pantoea sp. 1.19]